MTYKINFNKTNQVKTYVNGMLKCMNISADIEIIFSEESNVEIDRVVFHTKKDNEIYISYKSYMMLHIMSDNDEDAKAVCYAIEIVEDLKNHGYNINDKAIFQGAFKRYE